MDYKNGHGKKIISVDDAVEGLRGLFVTSPIFRGQVNYDWNIKPTLLRQERDEYLLDYEFFLMLPFGQLDIEKIPYLTTCDPLEYLTVLQHFGVATRLLDFSYDIYTALFFACYDPSNEYSQNDGKLIICSSEHYQNINLGNTDTEIFKKKYQDIDKALFNSRLDIQDIHILTPLSKNPRSRSQSGCFMFFPFTPLNLTDNHYVSLEDYTAASKKQAEERDTGYPWFLTKPVDKNYKKIILDELANKYNITYETIFVNNQYINECEVFFKQLEQFVCANKDQIKAARMKKNNQSKCNE